MEEQWSIWRWLFYGSLATIMIWVILKSVGLIQTPAWLEYGVPMTGAIIGFLSFHKEILDGLNSVKVDVALLKTKFDFLDKTVEKIDSRLDYMDKRTMHMDKDIEIVKRKINVV